MFIIEAPANFLPERTYIFSTIFGEFLGLEWRHQEVDREDVKISLSGSVQELILPDVFFSMPKSAWLTKDSLPLQPLVRWDYSSLLDSSFLVEKTIPIIFGDNQPQLGESPKGIRLPFDVFGSAFFMLTRYEEVVNPCCDENNPQCGEYGCFRMNELLAFQDNFMHRPIVDEYVELLWAAIKKLWPSVERKSRKFKQKITCDVDVPFDSSVHSYKSSFKRVLGDLIRRRSPIEAFKTIQYMVNFKRNGLNSDPYWQFDWMMDICEQANTSCAFYFITENNHARDGTSYWGNLDIEKLLSRIHYRGHEIGLHASYTTYNNPKQTLKEFQLLRDTCERLKIKQSKWGGRQHYLRWKAFITWRNWSSAKLDYDATVGFTEKAGFRCGTCHPYRVFDVLQSKELSLYEHPLIVMECSIFSNIFQNLDYDKGEETIKYYKNICRKFNGEFVLLWHNSYFPTKKYKEIYRNIITL